MAREKKINPNAQAPKLIRKIQHDLHWTQTNLEDYLGMSQQAVSNYLAGSVAREQYGVVEKLKDILAKKLPPPTAEEVINSEELNGPQTGSDDKKRQAGSQKTRVGPISARRIDGHRRRDS